MRKFVKFRFSFNYPCPRKLRDIVKMSVFEKEGSSQVQFLWEEYHKDKKENVAFSIKGSKYPILHKQLNDCPLFILPVLREKGYFNMMGQVQDKSVMFTYLEDFKKFGVNAQPFYVLTLFDELIAKKDLALIRGDIIHFKIEPNDALFLTEQTLRCFLQPEIYNEHIYNFNHQQEKFNYDKYLELFKK